MIQSKIQNIPDVKSFPYGLRVPNCQDRVCARGSFGWHVRRGSAYCARGEMENLIKEQFNSFTGRASTEIMRANQMPRYLSGMAYVLVSGLRRLGLQETNWSRRDCRG